MHDYLYLLHVFIVNFKVKIRFARMVIISTKKLLLI